MGNPRLLIFSGLLAFNGGFVDVVCFFGLKGLLAAHITGNLATLCASLVLGTAGLVSKILAVPEFMVIVALTHGAGILMRRGGWPAARILLGVEVILLALFFALAAHHGPFDDPDSLAALMVALSAIAAMAVQNAVQRVHVQRIPPTTFMTGNATQASIDVVDALTGAADATQKERLLNLGLNLVCFVIGCAVATLVFDKVGFASLALTVPVAVIAAVLTP